MISGKMGFMYKIYLPKNEESLKIFYRLGLFEKSIVTHGKNIGRKKKEVLQDFLINSARRHH